MCFDLIVSFCGSGVVGESFERYIRLEFAKNLGKKIRKINVNDLKNFEF